MLGRDALLRAANDGLNTYAANLMDHAKQYEAELSSIRAAFNPSPDPFCSPQEIARMQGLAFQSLQLKDIGRTRDGKLYCSALLGQLKEPFSMPPVTTVMPDGLTVYTDVSLRFAAGSKGVILEHSGVDAVVSPNAFAHWEQQSMSYMVLVINSATHEQVQLGGSRLTLPLNWLMQSGLYDTADDLYAVRHIDHDPIVVVTSESKQEVFAGHHSLPLGYILMGSLAGFCLGLAVGLFYLQQTGLVRQFRRALRNDMLELVYQPIHELPSRVCAGAEALARWKDDDGRPISPEVFVRFAEERGLIGELTSFVVRRAVAELGHILRAHPELTLSINIAASDLESEAFFQLLEEHVRRKGIAPRQIALELTERSTTKISRLQQAILRLHMEGYQVHIDDFGTGFSSLAYLHELAVDAIKIDRSFTRTIGTDAVTVSILPQILSLAESLHVEVIVEGVETEEQAEYLIRTGKTMQAQGWYFGRPVQADDLPKYRDQLQTTPTP
ncbi:MAG TPA: EAL domain-containing protein [Acidobacteriaceae bacterium]|nr:EAL domain-containing protein [Acidobacteriaceae bacterium]